MVFIKKEKVEEFRQKRKELVEKRDKGKLKAKEMTDDIYEFVDYFLSEDWLKIEDDGSLEFEDNVGKYYGDMYFAAFIAPFAEKGRMSFT